ncbi:hypothetical protein PFFCH_00103 [Plasmodium falciparum FCH/4]|uniref:Gamma tubulin complex component protein N-terminal domain-containing protein n=1 Tax=Plasmodium falciparum FCH/4 TaxID=1036724 RepID=A0A024VX28_PLAFA|nr:hypothetical protein PFFCH_00103 [Plasmodium falciparum FCH/4]
MMNREKLIKLLEKENKNRMNIKNVKFRDCHCMFNNYSQCYVNVKNKYENNDFWKYENIYGNDNIIKRSVQEEEEKKKWIEDNYNKESSLEFTYPYRYESNRNIFLIINSENINLGNSCVYNNDLIYIIHNNKRYEHMNLPKRTKKKKKKKKRKTKETKRKKRTLHNMKNDTFGSVTSMNDEKDYMKYNQDYHDKDDDDYDDEDDDEDDDDYDDEDDDDYEDDDDDDYDDDEDNYNNSYDNSYDNQYNTKHNKKKINPMYNSTIFETSNMNFCVKDEKRKKKEKQKNSIDKRNIIYSDDDSDNNYEHIFTHINSDLFFLSISNDHIEKENNLYIQNEQFINYDDVIFRKFKFHKNLFVNMDSCNSWIVIKKSILINEYITRSQKNDLVDINDVLYDVVNMYHRIYNCYTRLYINDDFLLINNKTKEILGVQNVASHINNTTNNNMNNIDNIHNVNNINNYNMREHLKRIEKKKNKINNYNNNNNNNDDVLSTTDTGDDMLSNNCEYNEESKYYKLVLIKKMTLKHLFNNQTDINILFSFHNACLSNYNKLDENYSYLLINNYNLNNKSEHLINISRKKNYTLDHTNNTYNNSNTNIITKNYSNNNHNNNNDNNILSNDLYSYFNNYLTKKIVENYSTYSLYIKECLLIIDILYILNNTYGNLIYIKEYYKYDHENYYTNIISNIVQKKKNEKRKKKSYKNIYDHSKENNRKQSNSIYSISSFSQKNYKNTNMINMNNLHGEEIPDDSMSSSNISSSNMSSSNKSSHNSATSYDIPKMRNRNKNNLNYINRKQLNNDLIYFFPKYKLIIHPTLLNVNEQNNSNIEIAREILYLGIYIRKIQKFIEINKRSQSCNFTFDIFCCCLSNISAHILNHINRIEENVRNIYNFTKINMKHNSTNNYNNNNNNNNNHDNNNFIHNDDLSLCLFDEYKLSTCTDPEEKKIFFSINNLFHKNIQDFNLFFNINIEKAEDISLYKIKISVLPLIQIGKLLNKIINKIIKKKKINNSKYLIDLIYNLQEYLNPDDINKKVLLYLLKNITTPLFDFIKNYIFYGKVKDTYKEFFIHENKHITPYYKQNHKPYFNNMYKYIFKKYIDLSTNYWGAKYIILNDKVPKFLKKLSNHIFITGKYIDVLSACSKILNIQRKTSFYLIDQNEYKNINENIDINMDTNQNNRNSFLFPKDVIYKRIYNENINNDQYTNSDHIRNPYFYNDLYKSERQTQHGMNKQIINGKVKYNYMNLPYEDEYYEHNKNDEKNKSYDDDYDDEDDDEDDDDYDDEDDDDYEDDNDDNNDDDEDEDDDDDDDDNNGDDNDDDDDDDDDDNDDDDEYVGDDDENVGDENIDDDDDDYYNNNGNEYNNYEEGYNDDEEERNNYLNKNDYDDEQEADDEEEDDDDDDDYDNDDDDEYKEYENDNGNDNYDEADSDHNNYNNTNENYHDDQVHNNSFNIKNNPLHMNDTNNQKKQHYNEEYYKTKNERIIKKNAELKNKGAIKKKKKI